MADAGHEYLYWEWWNPSPATSNRFPPMPADLNSDEYEAWELALYGDSPLGDQTTTGSRRAAGATRCT